MSEHDQQSAVVEYFKFRYPKYEGCIIAIPNAQGLAKSKKDAMRMFKFLEKEGAKKGVSDLFISVARGGKHGLWIEMKDVGKTYSSVSKEQRRHISLMRTQGYEAHWCAGEKKATALIDKYMRGEL